MPLAARPLLATGFPRIPSIRRTSTLQIARHAVVLPENASPDEEFDVVVVGSGAAGSAAALAAKHSSPDASVLVLEALAKPGGTTAKSGGVAWLPDNALMREKMLAGGREDRAAALRLMAQLAFPDRYRADAPDLGIGARAHEGLEAFYDAAGSMSTALASDGTLPHMDIMPARDYSAHLPDNLQPLGRSLMPGRPPLERRMVEAVFAALKLLRGPVEGWLGRAVPATKIMNFAWAPAARFVAGGTGQDLIKQLHAALRRKGVEVRTSAPADALLVAPGTPVSTPPTVVGVRTANGCTIAARGGVVLATGGYAHDRALLDAHGIAADATCASPGSVGSAVRLASAAGAEMGLMGEAWWAQSILERALERSNGERGPAGMEATGTIFFMRGSSMLLADAEGKRVVNEKAPYHDRSRVHASGPGRRLLLLVADRAAVDEVGSDGLLTLPQDPADPVYLHGQTVGEIASAADARLAELAARYPASPAATFSFSPDFATNLAATVERFNAMAAAGRDADFARGETPAEQDWEGVAVDTARGINPTMHPLVPPYVALFVCPAILDTKGGPATDASGRVIHAASGEPVVGLYAAGNAAASRAGEAYWQAGTTIGLAMVTGWIAGGHAAGLAAGARERGPTGERR